MKPGQIRVDVSQDVIDAVDKVVDFLSTLPAEKTTTSRSARIDALIYALHGEGVTVRELWEAAWHFNKKKGAFYPRPGDMLARINECRSEWPQMTVIVSEGICPTVSIVTAPTLAELERKADERYAEAWGCLPPCGDYRRSPDDQLAFQARVKALEEKRALALPEPKTMKPLEGPDQERRVREQIKAHKDGEA